MIELKIVEDIKYVNDANIHAEISVEKIMRIRERSIRRYFFRNPRYPRIAKATQAPIAVA
jgi:hypothetical protein